MWDEDGKERDEESEGRGKVKDEDERRTRDGPEVGYEGKCGTKESEG